MRNFVQLYAKSFNHFFNKWLNATQPLDVVHVKNFDPSK